MPRNQSMRLRILRRHINAALTARDNGMSANVTCPIAQALKDRGYDSPSVNSRSWYGYKNDNYVSGQQCDDARNFVRSFDVGESVSPQRVTLTIE
jgi:hypothetical protein